MDKKPKIFQIVITGIFVAMLVVGFLGFSGKITLPTEGGKINYGEVTLWGTIQPEVFSSIISNILKGEKNITIKYTQKHADVFNTELIEALAKGKGPDLILLSQDEIVKKLDKLAIIPYQTYTERTFKDTFLEEGEMFLRPEGVLALPFIIDPVVMYWNRDIFTNALVANPPTLWSDFYNLVPKITIRTSNGNITRSLVSFGEYRNVTNAKEIVTTLIMQAGSPIVTSKDGVFNAALDVAGPGDGENPVITAMRFFTEFSNSDKDSYSWNRSLPDSYSMFTSGDLALYFGYASEYQSIKKKNPHLNFDVAMMPQVGKNVAKLTFGKIQGFAITAASKNPNGAFYAANLLSSASAAYEASTILGLPPARRDLITNTPSDATIAVFYDSALISRAWFDPSPAETNTVFMSMFDGVTSGRSSMNDALSVANSLLARLIHAI